MPDKAERPQIAFLGVGLIGAPMARNGYSVTVWSRSRAKVEPLGKLGARVAGAVTKGLLLAASIGVDVAQIVQAISGGLCKSRILDVYGQRMVIRIFLPGGLLAFSLKDLNCDTVKCRRRIGCTGVWRFRSFRYPAVL